MRELSDQQAALLRHVAAGGHDNPWQDVGPVFTSAELVRRGVIHLTQVRPREWVTATVFIDRFNAELTDLGRKALRVYELRVRFSSLTEVRT